MAMNPGTKTAIAVAAGTAAAALLFREGERVHDAGGEAYLSPWTKDVAAWGAGATLIWLGYRYKSFLIAFMGAGVAALHVAEFASRKHVKVPTMGEAFEGRIPLQDVGAAKYASDMRELEALGLI